MKREDFRLLHGLRVRWAEVDMQGIVFNAHYLTYFDTGVTEYWRALAMPYAQGMQQLGGDLYLKKAAVEFHASARMDDQLDVALKSARLGNSSLAFDGAIFRGEELLITGELVYVFADPATQTPRPVPQALRGMIQAFEAGQNMVEVKLGSWNDLCGDAARLRTEVFVQEQRVPEHMEWDEDDAGALHAVAYNRLGQAIATARLLAYEPGTAKIGRMAVHKGLRGSGVGTQVLKALAGAAQARGERRILLHAQRTAQRFYARLGFQTTGEPFDEAGIPHIAMTSSLPLMG